jgi:uncharacterized protein YbaR (Trm112 family)
MRGTAAMPQVSAIREKVATVISEDLLASLLCPETRQKVSLASPDVVQRVNDAIRDGKLVNRHGKAVESPVQGILTREDNQFGYPVVDDIPIMLINEAIPLDQIASEGD